MAITGRGMAIVACYTIAYLYGRSLTSPRCAAMGVGICSLQPLLPCLPLGFTAHSSRSARARVAIAFVRGVYLGTVSSTQRPVMLPLNVPLDYSAAPSTLNRLAARSFCLICDEAAVQRPSVDTASLLRSRCCGCGWRSEAFCGRRARQRLCMSAASEAHRCSAVGS